MTNPASSRLIERDAQTLIEIDNCSKRYRRRVHGDEFWALRDVTLHVRQGEFMSILGPSGCGKTTLLKMLGGLLPYDAGTISIDGAPIAQQRHKSAFVFQNFALLPWATVRQNVAFGLKLRKVPKATRLEQAQEMLHRVGLANFADHYPHELSGGMQQRVGLARALVVDTPILLMDEPFGALDAQTRRYMQEDLAHLLAIQPKTVVFVTHSIDEAILLSDRIAVMAPSPGRVLEILDVPPLTRADDAAQQLQRDSLANRLWDLLRSMQPNHQFALHPERIAS